MNKVLSGNEKKKKIEIICRESAKSDDYACSTCGGDIRDIKCCNAKYCEIWVDDILQNKD